MPERLTIDHVAPYFAPHVGGVESHVEAVARELARRGHDVRVVTTRLPGTAERERVDGVLVRRVPSWLTWFTTPVTPGIVEALGERRADLVHSHSPPPLTSYFAARAVARARQPLVLTHHCDLEIPVPGGGLVVETYRRTLGRATLARAGAVIATTTSYARTSRSLWRRADVDVVPNPVDAERYRPAAEGGATGARARERHGLGERPVALFVGRLTHHKGVEEFVRASEFTRREVVHLVVGDGPRRAALERMARAPGRAGKVVFAGRVDWRDLPDYYGAASCGVLPSTGRLEAFGIAALEAMSSGKPVVGSNIPGVAEVIGDGETGLLAEPLDARDLAQQIDRLAADPEAARAMGKRARARVLAEFTVESVVDRIEAVYARTLDRGALDGTGGVPPGARR